MSDKLTDSEIVKAKAHFEYGIKCDIFQEPVLSYAKTVLEAFDEINRLQAENKRLKKGWKADIQLTAEAKAEAYKEFAERLKENKEVLFFGESGYHYRITDKQIDNLLKEMCGDNND